MTSDLFIRRAGGSTLRVRVVALRRRWRASVARNMARSGCAPGAIRAATGFSSRRLREVLAGPGSLWGEHAAAFRGEA